MVHSLERWVKTKAVAVITGASSGIGAATAEALVKHGLTVVGLARRLDRVEELAKKLQREKGKLFPYQADITVESDVVEAFQWIEKNIGPVHILINNAGILGGTLAGSLSEGTYESWKKTIDTNVLGLNLATREAIKQMRAHKINGHIVHMNSIAGHKVFNFPNSGVYTATKFAITALTEALRNELREAGTKIKITSISPGAVQTEMANYEEFKKQLSSGEQISEQMEAFLKAMDYLKPEDIANAVIYVLSTSENVQVHELTIKPVTQLQ